MGFTNCSTCGKRIGCDTNETIYSEGGILEINHGGGQCRECYAKDHRFCPKCDQPAMSTWKYCPMCGEKLKECDDVLAETETPSST